MAIDGMSEVLGNLNKLQSKLTNAMEEAANAAAMVGERYTKIEAPFKTGRLQRSYTTQTVEKSPAQAVVETFSDVVYAPTQEFGYKNIRGKPHLRPGFSHESEMADAAILKLKEVL